MTQSAVDLIQLVGKYMFSGGGKPAGDAPTDTSNTESPAPTEEPTK
jgi:phospholipid/cholesterol/gamma-HCH transport system substrate-binding protein